MRMWKCIESDERYFIAGKIYPEDKHGNLHDEDTLSFIGQDIDFAKDYGIGTAKTWNSNFKGAIQFKEVTFDLYLKTVENEV